MNIKKCLTSVLCAALVMLLFIPTALHTEAAAGPSITTTLTEHAIQRGSKKTFDVWARNASGDKIKAIVKLNGQKIDPTWDDNEKASYTLTFTQEGENIVTVSASSDGGKKKELTYHITYQKAKAGEQIGTAIWSVEAFTIGCGYLIEPVEMPIYEGETAAEQLVRLLHTNGFVGYYGGTVKSSFYLAYIADGTAAVAKYNNYQKSGTPSSAKKMNLSPSIPSILVPYLKDTMTFYDPNDYINNWKGYLGEFVFTNGSGWMYCVNNVFPNVGFADSYLSDGDVVRVQLTLGYGADIGGFGSVGTEIPDVDNQPTSGYFSVANKDQLTEAICKARTSGLLSRTNVKSAYNAALTVMTTLNASQSTVDSAVTKLNKAVANPSSDTTSSQTENTSGTGNQNTPNNSADNTNTNPSSTQKETDTQAGNNSNDTLSNQTDKSNAATPATKNPVSTENAEPGETSKDGNTDTIISAEKTKAPEATGAATTEQEDSKNTLSDTESENNGLTDKAAIFIVLGIALVLLATAAVVFVHRRKRNTITTDKEGIHRDE